MRIGSRDRGPVAASAIAVLALTAAALLGCAAESPGTSDPATMTPTPTDVAPPVTGAASAEPLDDGEYRAAVYVPTSGTIVGDENLAAGILIDLGDGCLGLEAEDGERALVAFPAGTTLENGLVSAVGMDAFGLDQPLRYAGALGSTTDGAFSLSMPAGCPSDTTDVWYFVVPSSAGTGSTDDD